MTENLSVVEETVEEPKLTFSENVQCDACYAAKAMWKVIGESGKELYLCGHHKNTNEKALGTWAKEFFEFEENTGE